MIKFLLAALLAVLLAACHNGNTPQVAATNPDSLAGTYSVNMHGTVIRFKVDENNGHYKMAQYDNRDGSWLDLKRDFTPLSKDAFEKKSGFPIDGYVAGMEAGDMLVMHVPAGWSRGLASTKTGYLLFWDRPYEMQKDS
jgi:hypothetical protein